MMSDSHCVRCAQRAYERQGLTDMLQSQVAWLGMLGDLTEAVRAEDWELAKELAARRITFPQPYPEVRV